MSVSQPSKLLGIILFLTLPLFLFSQNTIKNTAFERCHTDQKMQSAMEADPAYKKAMEEDLGKPTTSTSNTFGKNSSVVVTIPVHVIIVHPPGQSVGSGVNFSLVHVESQITVLNEDFRRTNADAGNTPNVFPAADVEIEFCLASFDPNGNPTDGITRYGTNDNLSSDEFSIKSATGWDRNDYLNIWVGSNLGGILGWAYLPSTNNLPNATVDGVVTASTTFGGPGFGTNVPYNLGRTTTHEVGHYLGLRHVWGSGGCGNDDNIADTPIQSSSNFGCPNHPSPSCSNGGDMFMNYMDYVNDNCMNAFTTGQGDRMHVILNNSRSSLLGSAAIVCNVSNAPLVLELVTQTNITCNSGNDGSITVLGSGGTGSFTYNINGGTAQNSNVFTGLTVGTYVVEADDGSSTISINVTLTEPTEVVPFISIQTDVSCFGMNDGVILVDGLGGTNIGGGYTYSINNEPFTSNNFFNNLSAGIYTILVRDELNCEGTTSVFITEPSELLSFIVNETQIDCSGNNNGQVVIGSTGGTANYLYSFDGGAYGNNNIFTNLSQGIYSVATVDLNNCQYSFNVTIIEPSAIQFDLTTQTNLNCFGDNNGVIEVSGQGGTGNLQYQINGQGYQNNNVFDNLSGGMYNLGVSDENGCVDSLSVEITEPAELLVELINQNNIPCSGGNTGSVTINITGGGGTPSIVFNGTTASGNSATFDSLTVGVYPVLVTDENNCSVSSTVEITENTAITLAITNTQNILCNGENNGSITAQSAGGSGSFIYVLNGVNQGANNIFTNLQGGTYTVESIDDAGCSDIEVVQIIEPVILEAQLLQQTNLNCFGENNGSIVVNGSGGTGILQYTLGSETNTIGQFNNLSSGNYTILILDENNCATSAQANITEPNQLISTIEAQQNISCFGENDGSVTINASGGTGTISAELDGNILTGNAVTFDGLVAGNYPIMVTDENNCQVTSFVEITENPVVALTIINSQNINCNGEGNGQIEVQANGGVGNFTYFLNGVNQGVNNTFTNLSEGSYLIEIMDGVGCDDAMTVEIAEPTILNVQLAQQSNLNCFGENNGTATIAASGGNGTIQYTLGSTTNTTGEFDNLSAGNYQVMILDENDCSELVEFEITQPTEVQVQIVENVAVNCFGGNTGSLEVLAVGGVQEFEFFNGTETNTTGIFNDLTAGNYTISVTDGNSCQTIIQSTVTQPSEIVANILSQEDVSCLGDNSGMILIGANGGVGNITFTLDGSANFTGEFSNLEAGSYAIQVLDENNCETTVNFQIEEPPELNIVLGNVTQASCAGQEGAIEVSANGGVGNYEFSIGNNSNTTGVFNGFSGGIYIVQVTDGNACTAALEIEINEPNSLNGSISQSQDVNCFGGNNGSVQVTGAGGVGDLNFTLGNETNTTGVFENIFAGNYNIILEDENNCSLLINLLISEPTELEMMVFNITEVNCYEGNGGAVNLASNGGTGTVQYTLGSETNTTGVFENLTAGTFNFMIEDENGCTDVMEIEISSPIEISSSIVNNQGITCAGEADGMIEILAVGGTNNFEYSFGNETNSTGVFEGIPAGAFSFVATDGNGCVEEISYTFDEPLVIEFENVASQNIDCNGNGNGMIQLGANGGIGNLTFTLGNESNTTGIFENLSQGNYEVVVTDENNCSTSMQIEIAEPQALEIAMENVTGINCFGANDGSLELSITGGTGDLEYTLGNETNSTGVFENIEAGIYNFTATDENNCSFLQEYTFTEPSQLVPNITQITSIDCFGSTTGAIQTTTTGGTGIPTYTLNAVSNTIGIFENLSAGIYEVLVIDEMNCSEIISITIDQPTEIGLEILNNIAADCAGAATGSVEVQGTNGVGDFIYELNGITNTTGVFENLSSENYELVTTDGNGCEIITMISISENSDITVESTTETDVDCFGNENGIINIVAGSPLGNLTYDLDGVINSTGVFENLPAGNYNVVIADPNNCLTMVSFEILEPTEVNLTLVETVSVDCFGASTGEAMLSASGGDGDFTYTLNGETNDTGIFTNLPAGMFEVQVTDGGGCAQMQVVEIVEPELLVIEVIATTEDTGNGNGTVTFAGSGGTPPYLFSLDGANLQSGESFVVLPGGNYEGFIQDGNGCIVQVTFTISMETAVVNLEEGISKLDIFPNPFFDQLFLDVELEISQELQLTLWNVAGVEVFTRKIELQNGNHRINLEVNQQVPAGSYFLKVGNENGSIGYFKLMKY
jgi:hypothetical protein